MEALIRGGRMAVGSLPALDAADAVRLQCQAFPETPAWPQLPKRAVAERITHQGLSGLPGLKFRPDGSGHWAEPEEGWGPFRRSLEEHRKAGDLEGAALRREEAPGFFSFLETGARHFRPETRAVKGQCAGPVTLGVALKGPDGSPLIGHAEAMGALSEFLLHHALWQAGELQALGKPVLFFLDEPSMGGSKGEKHGIDPAKAQAWMDHILEGLQEQGILTGIHTCGKGPFAWALRSRAECLHFDAFRDLEALAEEAEALKAFLSQGGWISYGLVPTAMSGGSFPEAAALVERWVAFAHDLDRKGISSDLLASRALFSTSCGLGGGSQAVAEEAARCLSGFTALWRIAAGIGWSS